MIKQLEENIKNWADHDETIRAVLVVGSQARRDHPADDLSDLDLILFSSKPERHTQDDAWLRTFGDLWVAILDQTGDGAAEWLTIYASGEKVDLALYHVDELSTAALERSNWHSVCERGVYVLVDKDAQAADVLPKEFGSPTTLPPSADEFEMEVKRFWYEVAVVAKFIKRRELWASYERDLKVKRQLRQLIEWQAQAHGRDTWHDGRFMMEWADTQIYTRLRDIFFQFDAAESWQALLESMNLFRELAQQLAAHYDFEYPQALDDNITRFIENLRKRS
jgi:aminoglycoside 6-adenylyltransferase